MLEKRPSRDRAPLRSTADVLTLYRAHARALVNRHAASGLPARDLELAAWRSILDAWRGASGGRDAFLEDAVSLMEGTVALLVRRRGAGGAPEQGTRDFVSLVDADAELFSELTRDDLRAARPWTIAALLTLRSGEWDGSTEPSPGGSEPVALLIVSGFLLRRVECTRSVRAEVLGPGNVVRGRGNDSRTDHHDPRATVRWRVLTPAELAIVDEDVLDALCRWPSAVTALFDRIATRPQEIALQAAATNARRMETRVMRLFTLLAERFGTPDRLGVRVPVPLTHDMLAELVGACRPAVSTAVTRLANDGRLQRAADRTWIVRT